MNCFRKLSFVDIRLQYSAHKNVHSQPELGSTKPTL